MLSITEQRKAVIAEAFTWRGTPYHHAARLKGVGADCITFIVCALENTGIVKGVQIEPYSQEWHLHRSTERYMNQVLEHCNEIEGPPEPADIVLWKFGRCFSHGALVVDWPIVIQAYVRKKVGLENALKSDLNYMAQGLKSIIRPKKFFRLKVWS